MEFTFSLSVCFRLFICVFQNRVRTKLRPAWRYFKILRYKLSSKEDSVANKDLAARSKVKVAVCTLTLCIDFSERVGSKILYRGKKDSTKRHHQRHYQRQPSKPPFSIQVVTGLSSIKHLFLFIFHFHNNKNNK